MVLGLQMLARDPQAVIKAGLFTALLMFAVQNVPPKTRSAWYEWAFQSDPPFVRPQAQFPIVLGIVLLLATGFIVEQRREVWRFLFFRNEPKTRANHSACVIWLHGVGDSGAGFDWLPDQVGMRHIKWVFPNAPKRDLSLGFTTRAWFDVHKMPISPDDGTDLAGLDSSVVRVLDLIEAQRADGIRAERILLGGFSQGAAVAAWAVARCPHRLGGCTLWSGYLPNQEALPAALRSSATVRAGAPFAYGHGDKDRKVPPPCGLRFVAALEAAVGVHLAHKVYEGVDHGCCEAQLESLKDMLRTVVPPLSAAAGSTLPSSPPVKRADRKAKRL